MKRKVITSIVLIVGALGLGQVAAKVLWSSRPVPARKPQEQAVLRVRGLRLAIGPATEWLEGYGSVRADRIASVRAEVAARVDFVINEFESGTPVREGDLLIRLDGREYKEVSDRAEALATSAKAKLAQLDTREDNLKNLIEIAKREVVIAENEVRRLEGLHAQDNAASREVDLAKLTLEQARTRLQTQQNELALLPTAHVDLRSSADASLASARLAQLDQARCEIHAPFDGILERIEVEVGDWVSRGSVLFTIVDPVRVEVPIRLPLAARASVRIGAVCRMVIESDPGHAWEGRISRIEPVADERTRTFAAFVEAVNRDPQHPLMPGMFVRGRIRGRTLEDVITIPRGAIHAGAVFLAVEGHAQRRPIRIRRTLGESAVIEGDVHAGDVLATSNLDQITDGMPIEVDLAPAETPVVTTGTASRAIP